jgi:hypothetical protein
LNLFKLFKNPIAKSLSKIAYDGFQTEKLVIKGKTINETLSVLEKSLNEKIKINDIVNFGLIVAEMEEKDFSYEISKIGRTDLIK